MLMIFKNSFKQTVRTPIKTGLFVILLAMVTTFTSIGLSMWLTVNENLERADSTFTTIGVVEFPERYNYDPRLGPPEVNSHDFSPIENSRYVQLFDKRDFLQTYSKDVMVDPMNLEQVTRNGNVLSILEFEVIRMGSDTEAPKAIVTEVYHTEADSPTLGDIVPYEIGQEINLTPFEFRFNEVPEFEFEKGKKYIGRFQMGQYFPQITNEDDYFVKEVTFENYLDHEDYYHFKKQIEELHMSVHTFGVYATNDINTMFAFHQDNITMREGRVFSPEEYQEGSKVVLVSRETAERNNLSVGDVIELNFYSGIGRQPASWTSELNLSRAWPGDLGKDYISQIPYGTDSLYSGSYEIVGIYNQLRNLGRSYGFYDDTLFIPKNSVKNAPPMYYLNNYISFQLTNGTAEAFIDHIQPYLDEVRLNPNLDELVISIYDQGYSNVSEALGNMKNIAILLTLIGVGAGVVLVVLLGYLFVGKQRRTIAIMYSLGVNRINGMKFLFLSILMITLIAISIGSIISMQLTESIIEDLYAQGIEEGETSFSNIYGSGIESEYDFAISNSIVAPLISASSVLILTILVGFLYARGILNAQPMQVLTSKGE